MKMEITVPSLGYRQCVTISEPLNKKIVESVSERGIREV
jgi:hypothetical protein